MEKQKIFWVVLSVSIFIVVVLVVGVFLLKQNPSEEAGTVNPISNTATRVFEFDRQPGTTPAAQGGPAVVEPSPSEPEVLKLVIGEGTPEKAPQTLPQPLPPAPGAAAVPQPQTQAAPTTPVAQAPTQAPAQAAPAQKPAQAAPAQKPAQAPAQKPAPAPAQKPASKPAVPETRHVVEYWIQTGSYKSQTLAEDLAHNLSEKGLAGRVFSYSMGKDTYFRVRIGPYSNRSEAGKFLTLVKQIQGLESSYISSVTSVRVVN